MLLFGHRFIPSERFYHIDDIDAIDNTPANSILYLPFSEENLDIIAHMRDNRLRYVLCAKTLNEVIFCENLGASFIAVHADLAKAAQKAADTYLFDAKILCHIDDESEIEALVYEGVDGVLFSDAVVKITG
jgi:hypothetical protein